MDGPTVTALREKAAKLGCHVLMGSFIERDGWELFNTSVLLNPRGEIAARHRKIHLFGYHSDESKLLARGSEIVVAKTPWGPAGISTCYDLRFPELYRNMLDRAGGGRMSRNRWAPLTSQRKGRVKGKKSRSDGPHGDLSS